MRFGKFVLYGLFLCCLAMAIPQTASAAQSVLFDHTKKVALLPLIDKQHVDDPAITKMVLDKLLSLYASNDLNTYAKATDAEMQAVYPALAKPDKIKKVDLAKLKEIAVATKSNLVIGAVINQCYEDIRYGLSGYPSQETYVNISIIGYNADTGKTINITRHDSYTGQYATWGTKKAITEKVMDSLLNRVDLGYDN